MKIKTIDINSKEWTDTYGNTYFSAKVILNHAMKTEKIIKLPFQYGYGSHCEDMAYKELQKQGYMKLDNSHCLPVVCEMKNIIFRHYKQTGCEKKEL